MNSRVLLNDFQIFVCIVRYGHYGGWERRAERQQKLLSIQCVTECDRTVGYEANGASECLVCWRGNKSGVYAISRL